MSGQLSELSARERELAEQLRSARERLRKLAVASYVNGGASSSVDYLLRAENPADLSRRRKLLTSVGRVRNRAVKDYAAARRDASERLRRSVADLDDLNAAGATAKAELVAATAQIGRLSAELDRARRLRTLLLAVTPVAGSDIPGLFLDAYRAAASAMAELDPGCGLRWTALAGVGRIARKHALLPADTNQPQQCGAASASLDLRYRRAGRHARQERPRWTHEQQRAAAALR